MRTQSMQFIHVNDDRHIEVVRRGSVITIREMLDGEAQVVTLSVNEFEALHSLVHDNVLV